MTRKTTRQQRAEKNAQIDSLKQEVARLEKQDIERLGKIALLAGLADCEVSDKTLLKEFQALASRFQQGKEKPISENANAVEQGRAPLTEVSDDGEKTGHTPQNPIGRTGD